MKLMEHLARRSSAVLLALTALALAPLASAALFAQEAQRAGGEANLVVPDLSNATFMGFNGRHLIAGFSQDIQLEDGTFTPRAMAYGNFSMVGVCQNPFLMATAPTLPVWSAAGITLPGKGNPVAGLTGTNSAVPSRRDRMLLTTSARIIHTAACTNNADAASMTAGRNVMNPGSGPST